MNNATNSLSFVLCLRTLSRRLVYVSISVLIPADTDKLTSLTILATPDRPREGPFAYPPFMAFPRTTPGTLFPVKIIECWDIRVRRLGDFLRLLDSLPSVESVDLMRATFVETAEEARGPIRRSSMLTTVHVRACGDRSMEAQCALASAIMESQHRVPAEFSAPWGSMLALYPDDLRVCGGAWLQRLGGAYTVATCQTSR